MKSQSELLADATVSGSIASILSTVVLALRGLREDGTPYAPTNAVSHWLTGNEAMHEDDLSLRYTGVGYATHHVSSIFWAYFYERWFGRDAERDEIAPAMLGGAAVAGMACFVDYQLTPKRFQPGFDARLSKSSLFLTYAAIAVALPLRGLLSGRRYG